jgi:hypothetical protein
VEKWYIELPSGAYGTFGHLVMVFHNHFQLPIHYDAGLELLSTLRQDTGTHILDHIQEWRRWKRLIKTPIPTKFILDGFLSLFTLLSQRTLLLTGLQLRKNLSLESNNWI